MEWNLEEALDYYRGQGAPADQNALKNLLQEIQREFSAIPLWIPSRIAAAYGIRESYLLAIIRRFPSLRLENTHCLELCGGPSCGKHTRLLALAEQLRDQTPGIFTLRQIPCMHLCGQGPNLKWDGEIHCGADEALIRSLVEQARKEQKK